VIVALAAVLVVALVTILGWSESRHTATAPTVNAVAVAGRVLLEGGPVGSYGVHPVAAPLVVTGTTTAGAHVLRRLTSDRAGRFTLNLPPGAYTITAVIGSDEPHAKIAVRPGHPVRTLISVG
jgi:hypothetical protein